MQARVTGVCQQWLHMPDPAPLLATLEVVAANLLEGDLVWPVLVGPTLLPRGRDEGAKRGN